MITKAQGRTALLIVALGIAFWVSLPSTGGSDGVNERPSLVEAPREQPYSMDIAVLAGEPQALDAQVHESGWLGEGPGGTLSAAGRITGVVTDSGGKRIAGAELVDSRRAGIKLITDSTGSFELAPWCGDAFRVIALHPEYTPEETYVDHSSVQADSIVIVLSKGASLCVDVRSGGGEPIANATIRVIDAASAESEGTIIGDAAARSVSDTLMRLRAAFIRYGTSDGAGNSCVRGIPPGAYVVQIRAAGMAPYAVDVQIEAIAESYLNVVMTREAFIAGVVVGPSGPDAQAKVHLRLGDAYRLARTDRNGYFRLGELESLPPRGDIYVESDSLSSRYYPQERLDSSQLFLELESKWPLEVVVFDEDVGSPLNSLVQVERRVFRGFMRGLIAQPSNHQVVNGVLLLDDIESVIDVLIMTDSHGRSITVTQPALKWRGVTHHVRLSIGERADKFLVTVLDRASGLPLGNPTFTLDTRYSKNGLELGGWGYVTASFDADRNAYELSIEELIELCPGGEGRVVVSAQGWSSAMPIPVVSEGAWVAGSSVDVYLDQAQ